MALAMGAVVLPKGNVVVYHPQMGDDLAALPIAHSTVIATFKPDYDHFARMGFAVAQSGAAAQPADLAIVCLPRAKAAARDLLAQAALNLGPNGRIVLDGQKTDGIEAALKDLKSLGADLGEVISKAHGKLAVFAPSGPLIAHLQTWAAAPQSVEGGFITRAGVFSADGPDRASQLLGAALPARLGARVADFGAGWGYLSRAILTHEGVQSLDILEADGTALDCARVNITDPRAAFHWADVATHRPARLWDTVVMNPPFHTTRSADAGLGLAFITAAHRGLAPNGQLWLVANRQLPYAEAARALFRDVEELGNDATFRLIRAAIPLRHR
jgi:16S rRNA (guanine1207-N2)-methyltransferase